MSLPAQAQKQPIFSLPTNQKVVALTFDGTFSRGSIDDIVRILNEQSVTATFFLAGTFLDNFPDDARFIKNNCFALGNHSNTHPDFTTITDTQIRNEVNEAERKALNVTGIDTKPFFRLPYGAYNDRVINTVSQTGYNRIMQWDIDTIDWRENTTRQDIINRVQRGLKPGSIVLMHVAGFHTAEALPEVIRFIKGQGYTFTDMPRFYGIAQPQQHVPGLNDVLCFNWYFEPIGVLAAKGIVSGYTDKTFKPLLPISRAEFTKLVVTSQNIPVATTFTGRFPDVPQSHWAWPYIEAAAQRGLIEGRPNGRFAPDESVQRQEAAKIIVLAKNYPINTSGQQFSDVPMSLWSFPYVMTARNNGVITGYFDGTFKPFDAAKRAEAAAIIQRVTP
ncbi:S-layer homology domain-containing protein [Candidatus Aquicultor sp.]